MSFLMSKQLIKNIIPRTNCNRMYRFPSYSTNAPQQQPVSKTKQFMKKYGYVGIGTYTVLSFADLALTMAVISVTGAEKVMEAEHYVISKVKGWAGMEHPPLDKSQLDKRPSFTSLFLVAYGIHKTVMLPIRLSLTAAITPAVAKRLQHWGWLKNKINK